MLGIADPPLQGSALPFRFESPFRESGLSVAGLIQQQSLRALAAGRPHVVWLELSQPLAHIVRPVEYGLSQVDARWCPAQGVPTPQAADIYPELPGTFTIGPESGK